MSALLERLEREGVLGALDVELARTLARISGEEDEHVLLAVALASRDVQNGHVCVDLARTAREGLGELSDGSAAALPSYEAWRDTLARSKLVRRADPHAHAERPIVLDDEGRLYLARYHDHEVRVARHIVRLAQAEAGDATPEPALLDRLFAPRPDGSLDRQREAARASCTRKLSVIVGGPGTGKTSTVVKMLALLARAAEARGAAFPRILLTAPTGKAAQRLSEAIEKARAKLDVDARLRDAIPSEAVTVHRALGPMGMTSTRFRHGPDHPLDCDVLLVDEASMVDLALMRRLLDAVPERARVIMLGDADQLASVEAGGVLADVCAAAEVEGSPLAACVSRLTQSYRYPEDSGIAALARAVHAQDADEAMRVLQEGGADVALYPPLAAHALGRAFEREVREAYRGLRQGAVDAKLAVLDGFRVLCAHRQGPDGVEALNLAIARTVRGRPVRAHDNYAGRPILITRNDYASGLFNGDVGVLHNDGPRAPLSACFPIAGGRIRHLALGRLPTHESVYAMTVHKSQGSEFDRVAIVLPERPTPILTRELLYTGITRARRGVNLYTSEATLRASIRSRVTRTSGLADQLTLRP